MKIAIGGLIRKLTKRRPTHPFHLALVVATGLLGIILIWTPDELVFAWDGWPSLVLGLTCLTSAFFMLFGWASRSRYFSEWGLLLAVGAWTARGVYVMLVLRDAGETVIPWWASSLFSFAWAFGACGAYLLDRYQNEMMGDNHE